MTKKILPPGREGAKVLANDLRQALPDNFIWDFTAVLEKINDMSIFNEDMKDRYGKSCGYIGCAMGYAEVFYSNIKDRDDLEDHLEMNYEDGEAIFYLSERFYPGKNYTEITPIDVADALDRWLEETKNQETNQ